MDYNDNGFIRVCVAILCVMLLVYGIAKCEGNAMTRCERAGGEYVILYKSALCLKPDSVIQNY